MGRKQRAHRPVKYFIYSDPSGETDIFYHQGMNRLGGIYQLDANNDIMKLKFRLQKFNEICQDTVLPVPDIIKKKYVSKSNQQASSDGIQVINDDMEEILDDQLEFLENFDLYFSDNDTIDSELALGEIMW